MNFQGMQRSLVWLKHGHVVRDKAGQGHVHGESFVPSTWWKCKASGRGRWWAGRRREWPHVGWCTTLRHILSPQPFPHGWYSVSASLSEDSGTEPSCWDSRHCECPRRLDWTWWWEMSSRRETSKNWTSDRNLIDHEAERVPGLAGRNPSYLL